MTKWLMLTLSCGVAVGCGGDCVEDVLSDDGTGTPSVLTLGVYELVGGCYEDRDKDLEMDLDAACHTWSRTTTKADDHSSESHEHFNAAADMAYDQVTFTWTEYGPEASQGDIEELCESGVAGTAKEATWNDYVEEPPGSGAWLRIKSVEY